jgi:predicted nucleic acid-binding protein
MRRSFPRTALVDTGYWYALLEERDKEQHKQALTDSEIFLRLRYLIPWPVMYETLCTRWTRRPLIVRQFERILKTPNAAKLDDTKYRDAALAIALDTAKPHPNTISLVDAVLRLVLDDRSNRVDCMFTFNPGDFRDVCVRRRVQIYGDQPGG